MTGSHTIEEVRAVKATAMEVFARLAPVVGIGVARIGDGYGLKVNLRSRPSRGVMLPRTLGGVPVRVEVVGRIRKHSG